MKTYVVSELYKGAELGKLYAKNLKQAKNKANKLYAQMVFVREYSSSLDQDAIQNKIDEVTK